MWYCHSFLQQRMCYLRNKFTRNGCSSSFTWMQGLSASFQHMQEPFKYIKPCQKARLSFLAEKPDAWNPMLFEKNGTIQFDIRVSLKRPVGLEATWSNNSGVPQILFLSPSKRSRRWRGDLQWNHLWVGRFCIGKCSHFETNCWAFRFVTYDKIIAGVFERND